MSRRPTQPARGPARAAADRPAPTRPRSGGAVTEPSTAPPPTGARGRRPTAPTAPTAPTSRADPPRGGAQPATLRRRAPAAEASAPPARRLPRADPAIRARRANRADRTTLRERASLPTASVLAFAARARGRRRPGGRGVVAVLVALAVLGVAGWVVLASPLLALREVQVVGTQRLDAAQVTALAAPQVGTPLARVDAGGLEAAVEQLPLVADAEVLRTWPHGLEVRVTERVAVAVVASAGGVTLVDATGRQLQELPQPPPDLPTLTPETTAAGERATSSAVRVLEQLPPELRAQVATTDARTPDSVTLSLRSGATVVWGSADDSAEKAAVLAVLLSQPAEVYDVSSPGTPVTR